MTAQPLPPKPSTRQRTTLERTYQASVADLWELWTTKEGFESWWGPEGFRVEVRSLELRPGGQLQYAMIATDPHQIAFMKQAGMPISTDTAITFTEIVPQRRLGYLNLVGFVPGVAPYEVGTVMELHPGPQGVTMRITLDGMHDAEWSQRMAAGFESQLRKLEPRFGRPAGR